MPLRVAVHVNGNHWHPLLPLDGEGRLVLTPLRESGAVPLAPEGPTYLSGVRGGLGREALERAAAYVRGYPHSAEYAAVLRASREAHRVAGKS